jgi:hypothetical protein
MKVRHGGTVHTGFHEKLQTESPNLNVSFGKHKRAPFKIAGGSGSNNWPQGEKTGDENPGRDHDDEHFVA